MPVSPRHYQYQLIFLIGACALSASLPVTADAPLGWIHSGNTSAYALDQFSFEISATKLQVNDAIDFLNFREDLLAGQQRLLGDSGDLDGERVELFVGITDDLTFFYSQQQQEFTVDLGPINSVKLVDISKSLNTEMASAGLKWTFWRGQLLNPDNRTSAAALELTQTRNETDSFDVTVNEIYLPDLTVLFANPQTFSVADLEDEGWKARIIYTWPLTTQAALNASVWGGYGKSDATSSTTSDITSTTVRNFFEQQFEVEESYYFLGGSLNWNVTPRLPIALNYEYIRVNESLFTRHPDPPRNGLPGFLTQAPVIASGNHTLSAQIAYWITPQIHVKLLGNVYTNQFLGILPHYSNPLSGSFADQPYGFAGLAVGFSF